MLTRPGLCPPHASPAVIQAASATTVPLEGPGQSRATLTKLHERVNKQLSHNPRNLEPGILRTQLSAASSPSGGPFWACPRVSVTPRCSYHTGLAALSLHWMESL